MEKDKNGYIKQEGESYWNPEKKGEKLEGVIIDVQEGMYGMRYVIKTKNNDEYTTPSHKVLQARMSKAEKGDLIKIIYGGEVPPAVRGNNPTRIYEVWLKKKELTIVSCDEVEELM